MEKVSKDVLFLIAIEMEYPDILRFCSTSARINKYICANNDFWRNKLYRKYPFLLSHIQQRNDLKSLYRDVEKEIEKIKTESNGKNSGFDKLQYITPEFSNFFLNADFGNIPDTSVPLNYILWPLLRKGIFTHNLAQKLLSFHLRKYEIREDAETAGILYQKIFYTVSPEMNVYLNNSLTDLEKDNIRVFNRNKFIYKNFSRLIMKGFSHKYLENPAKELIDISENISDLKLFEI
jgi:hypothetical protein